MASVSLALLRAIAAVRGQLAVLDEGIAEQLARHPDGAVFTSLPRSGSVRAATLLAEIGDCRERFPTPGSLACLAGATPSTRQSGQRRVVTFRFACDKKLRAAVIDFADGTNGCDANDDLDRPADASSAVAQPLSCSAPRLRWPTTAVRARTSPFGSRGLVSERKRPTSSHDTASTGN